MAVFRVSPFQAFQQTLRYKEKRFLFSRKIMRLVTKLELQRNVEITDNDDKNTVFNRRVKLTKFIKVFFDIAYYLGISPFRFVRSKDENTVGYWCYKKKTWRPQQVVCAVLHLCCVLLLISHFRESTPDNLVAQRKNPTVYFKMIQELCTIFFKVVTLKRFWLNGDDYLHVLNFVLKAKDIPIRQKRVTLTYNLYKYFGCVGSTVKVFACLVLGYFFLFPIRKWTPSWWLRSLVDKARYIFCFSKLLKSSDVPELSEFTAWDWVLMVIMIFTLIVRYGLSELCDLCILACSLTLWVTSGSFEDEIGDLLKPSRDSKGQDGELPKIVQMNPVVQPWPQIYKSFQAIQDLSELINKALGSQVTWYMAEGLMFYSISLNSVFLTKDEFRRIHKIMFFVITYIVLYVSADICKKMESGKIWLTKKNNMKTVQMDEAYLVLHEVITKEIGIQGSKIFTITFPLVAGYLSLIVTFFIICVQEVELEADA